VTITIDPAIAALAGSAIGGLTTLAVAWMTQRTIANAANGARERTARQDLYRQFIEEAAKLYGNAMVSNKVEIPMLVGAYALITGCVCCHLPTLSTKPMQRCEALLIRIFR